MRNEFFVPLKHEPLFCAPLGVVKTVSNHKLNIDNFSTRRQFRNVFGWPTNDIMLYETAQSESVARAILQRIPINKDTGLVEDGCSIDEKFADLCPANWSSPAEYVRYQKRVAQNYFERIEKKRVAAEKQKENTISFEDNKSE